MEIIKNVIRDIKPEYWIALGVVVSTVSLINGHLLSDLREAIR